MTGVFPISSLDRLSHTWCMLLQCCLRAFFTFSLVDGYSPVRHFSADDVYGGRARSTLYAIHATAAVLIDYACFPLPFQPNMPHWCSADPVHSLPFRSTVNPHTYLVHGTKRCGERDQSG